MIIKITYGSTIHTDRTIAKYECWTFETEEEFWKQYDLTADDNTTADPNEITIMLVETNLVSENNSKAVLM